MLYAPSVGLNDNAEVKYDDWGGREKRVKKKNEKEQEISKVF